MRRSKRGWTHLNGWYTTCPSAPTVVVYVIEPGWIDAACWGVVWGYGPDATAACDIMGDTGAPETYGFISGVSSSRSFAV